MGETEKRTCQHMMDTCIVHVTVAAGPCLIMRLAISTFQHQRHTYIHTYIKKHTYIHTYNLYETYVHMCMHIHIYMYIYIYKRVHMCMRVYVDTYIICVSISMHK